MQATESVPPVQEVKLPKPKVRRRAKRKRRRPLMQTDFLLMKKVWIWKLLSYPLASQMVFPNISKLGSYRKIRRLVKEGYLVEREVSRLGMDVIQLSKKGFDCIKFDMSEMRQLRFAAQSVDHDYITSVFQLGEFVHGVPKGVELLTEQQLQAVDTTLLPSWTPKSYDHIPDGYIHFEAGEIKKTIAIEVELNYKSPIRYLKMGHYFDMNHEKVDVVLWLCDRVALAQFISDQLYRSNLRNFEVHNFVLLSDFRSLGWDAQSRSGSAKGQSIKEIYLANGYQNPVQSLVNPWSEKTKNVFFNFRKSPNISNVCAKPPDAKS